MISQVILSEEGRVCVCGVGGLAGGGGVGHIERKVRGVISVHGKYICTLYQ